MRIALFTDTYLPQTNGVARTLHRLAGHLHRRGIEHLLFTPKSAPEEHFADPVRPIASIPFFCILSAGWRRPVCPPSSKSCGPSGLICCIWPPRSTLVCTVSAMPRSRTSLMLPPITPTSTVISNTTG